MVKEEYGVVIVVAKTGGIKIEGREGWLNPQKRGFTEGLRKGDGIVYELEGGMISSLEKVNGEKEVVDWDGKERRVVRMNVLNRATDMAVAKLIEKSYIKNIAEDFEHWVYRKE